MKNFFLLSHIILFLGCATNEFTPSKNPSKNIHSRCYEYAHHQYEKLFSKSLTDIRAMIIWKEFYDYCLYKKGTVKMPEQHDQP